MVLFLMRVILHWFLGNGNTLATIVTVGLGVLVLSGLCCCRCSAKDKDDIFRSGQA